MINKTFEEIFRELETDPFLRPDFEIMWIYQQSRIDELENRIGRVVDMLSGFSCICNISTNRTLEALLLKALDILVQKDDKNYGEKNKK